MNEIKQNLIKQIKEKQNLLIESDINSENYTIILNEIELLNKELKEVSNINDNNIDRKIKEYQKIKSKYSFLQELNMEQILNILTNTKYLNKQIIEAYDLETKFPEILYDFKNEILLNNIDYTKINNSETIEKILNILNKKYDTFKINLEEFYKILRNFYPTSYELLKSAINNNEHPSTNTLNLLKGIGQDSLIEAILKNYKIKKRLENEPFIFKDKRKEKIETINIKTKEYLKSLYRNIGLFIKQNYKEYKDKLGLTIDEFKEEDIVTLYTNILEQSSQKNTSIKQTIKKYDILRQTYSGFEMHINKKLKNIGVDIDKLKSNNIDLFSLDKEDIFEILSKLNLYKKIKEQEYKETPTLLLKAGNKND